MAGPMGLFDYISDNTLHYALRLDASNAGAVGGTVVTTGVGKPGRLRPRYILLKHPTSGRERKIVVPDPAAGIWTSTATGTTLTITDFSATPSVQTAYLVAGRVGEKRYA